MDERKYWAFQVRGTPASVLQKLTNFVITNGLREQIPTYCLENLVHKKGQHEFLLFLSIVSNEQADYIPAEIKEGLSYANISTLVVDYPLKYEDIRAMTRPEAELAVGSYARRLDYHPPQMNRLINPFDFASARDSTEIVDEAYNRLLYWMSAVGNGTWQRFQDACKSLGLTNSAEARHIFRRLRLLGHVEYLNDGTHWTICPSCLVKITNHDGDKYFLAGAQVPSLVHKIQDIMQVEIVKESNHGGPESVFMIFNSDNDVHRLTELLKESYPYFRDAGVASSKLAAILPDIESWYRRLLNTIPVVNELYAFAKWDGEKFIPIAQPNEAGMYSLTSLDSRESDFRYYYYFDSEQNCWQQGDWYGLRFLANYQLNIRGRLSHEPKSQKLFIPSIHHVPDLFERALVLASGTLPLQSRNGLVYENIDDFLVETICIKLHAQLIKGN